MRCFALAVAFLHLLSAQSSEPAEQRRSYVLGPDDELLIGVVDAEEIGAKPVRIEMNGSIRLPMVGRLQASGLTAVELEAQLARRLKPFILEPDVTVSVVGFRSHPVSVVGSVKTPGVYQLQGRRTLIEILSLAGGLADDAGPAVKITRRAESGRIPLPNALPDATGRFTVAEVSVKSITKAQNPDENIVIEAFDVVSVPKAEIVYVTGQVVRSGGFVLNERNTLSALQALSLAGGLDRSASPQKSRILRFAAGAAREEIPVDLRQILAGRAPDVSLRADDILFIPASGAKKAAVRAIEAMIQLGTGVAIYRR